MYVKIYVYLIYAHYLNFYQIGNQYFNQFKLNIPSLPKRLNRFRLVGNFRSSQRVVGCANGVIWKLQEVADIGLHLEKIGNTYARRLRDPYSLTNLVRASHQRTDAEVD